MAASTESSICDPSDLENPNDLETEAENQFNSFDDLDLPPLRMNATRVKERLYSSTSSLQIPPNLASQATKKRYSLDGTTPRSRSRSPSLKDKGTATTDNSSFSSLEDVDPDILYDKMGFVELDFKEQQLKQQQSAKQQHHKLQPVSERMSEDTLEDVHAFSDLSITRPASSVGGSTSGDVGSHVLEPLDELDELVEAVEETDDTIEEVSTGEDLSGQVILTNMENLSIEEQTQNTINTTDSTT